MAGLNSLQRKLKQKIINSLQETGVSPDNLINEEADGNFVQITYDKGEIWIYKDLVECVTKDENGHYEFELEQYDSENSLIDDVITFIGKNWLR
jgi:hypothetical protein